MIYNTLRCPFVVLLTNQMHAGKQTVCSLKWIRSHKLSCDDYFSMHIKPKNLKLYFNSILYMVERHKKISTTVTSRHFIL